LFCFSFVWAACFVFGPMLPGSVSSVELKAELNPLSLLLLLLLLLIVCLADC
jgi:hypothetical protein